MLKRTISGIVLVVLMLFMIDYSDKTYVALWVILAFATLAEFGGLSLRHGHKFGKRSTLVAAVGALYILCSYVLLMTGFGRDEHSRMLVMTFITLIWTNDVGAYLVGSAMGKHKMCPTISPKKSWEGFAGGVVFAIAGGVAWNLLFWSRIPPSVDMLFMNQWLFFGALGLVAALGAVGGDLLESWYKRKLGVKDSGSIIPGHGGMLDRFDALLLATPLVWIFLMLTIKNGQLAIF